MNADVKKKIDDMVAQVGTAEKQQSQVHLLTEILDTLKHIDEVLTNGNTNRESTEQK